LELSSFAFDSRWKAQARKISSVGERRPFNIGGRINPALAFQKPQSGPCADFATAVWQQKAGAGDNTIS
jgi:hypothetical protein